MVLTDVRSELHARYQNPGWKEHMQMPETISTLLESVYLHPTTEVKMPDAPAAVPDLGTHHKVSYIDWCILCTHVYGQVGLTSSLNSWALLLTTENDLCSEGNVGFQFHVHCGTYFREGFHLS